ncbi:type II secretion system protein [Chrysiogenes arsenatis]|uniref:type II secretion system protein n=1 Tax=Chrysiogenes arsenatis TaxID=309797 RepID=UPI00041172E2|nr:prepilin-type N-terminal cleavage/methylation domain-containing protein [Chrysiogenes arsenatis]
MHHRTHAGFTLIEAAIVLVIVGLLIGGILKGQELIASAKVKQTISDMNGISTAYNAYVDEYRRQPGDDGPAATLTARGGSWSELSGSAVGNRNGIVDAALASTFTGSEEGGYFWNHLRAAGFMSGDVQATGVDTLPLNPFGGRFGFTSATAFGLTGNKICASEVSGRAAAAIDTQIDDGKPNSGQVRAAQATAGAHTAPSATAATSYSEDQVYTLCRRL